MSVEDRKLAELIGVSRDTVRAWRKSGKIPERWKYRFEAAQRGQNMVGFKYDDLGRPITRWASSAVCGIGQVGAMRCGVSLDQVKCKNITAKVIFRRRKTAV